MSRAFDFFAETEKFALSETLAELSQTLSQLLEDND